MFLMNGPELTDEKCDGWLSSKKEPETHIYKLLNMIWTLGFSCVKLSITYFIYLWWITTCFQKSTSFAQFFVKLQKSSGDGRNKLRPTKVMLVANSKQKVVISTHTQRCKLHTKIFWLWRYSYWWDNITIFTPASCLIFCAFERSWALFGKKNAETRFFPLKPDFFLVFQQMLIWLAKNPFLATILKGWHFLCHLYKQCSLNTVSCKIG